jgi:hypothetical protein
MGAFRWPNPVKLQAIRKTIRARKKAVLQPMATRRGLDSLEISLRSSILKRINQIDIL